MSLKTQELKLTSNKNAQKPKGLYRSLKVINCGLVKSNCQKCQCWCLKEKAESGSYIAMGDPSTWDLPKFNKANRKQMLAKGVKAGIAMWDQVMPSGISTNVPSVHPFNSFQHIFYVSILLSQ